MLYFSIRFEVSKLGEKDSFGSNFMLLHPDPPRMLFRDLLERNNSIPEASVRNASMNGKDLTPKLFRNLDSHFFILHNRSGLNGYNSVPT